MPRSGLDVGRLVGVLAEHADGLGVVEDVRRVLRRAVRVDRRRDRADERKREVEQRPFHRRPREQCERLATADATGEEAVGEVLDPLGRLGPGDLVPVVVVLDEVGGAGRRSRATAAYKILCDPEARADYDEALREGRPPPPLPGGSSAAASAPASEAAAPEAPEAPRQDRQPTSKIFEQDRAGKDDIVRRATLARIRHALGVVIGDCDMREVRGFDLACVPRAKAVTSLTISQFFKRQVMPIVLVRLGPSLTGRWRPMRSRTRCGRGSMAKASRWRCS